MDRLRSQVGQAWRRMVLQRFVASLPTTLTACLLGGLIAVACSIYWQLGWVWWQPLAISAGVAVLASLAWTWWTRQSSLEAAIELDRRFGLKERISSALALGSDSLETPIGAALIQDAMKRAEKVHVPEKFEVSVSKWAMLPLAPALAAFLLATFWNPVQENSEASAEALKVETNKKVVKKATDDIKKKLEEQRKKAQESGLKDAEKIFTEIERGVKDINDKNNGDRKDTLVKLNNLAKDLENRRKELGGSEEVKKQLNQQFKDMAKGPADKMAEAIKSGDFKQAMKELQKLKEEIAKGKMSDEARQKFNQQLKDMERKLNEMAENHEKAKNELKKQIEQKKQQVAQESDPQKKQKAQEELEKMEKQQEQMEQQSGNMSDMKKMAEKMGQCSKAMEAGKSGEAAQAMEEIGEKLEAMAQESEELEMMDEAMSEIADAKQSMNQGMGNQGMQGNQPGNGNGLGEGRGFGDRPEERDDTGMYDTTVKQKVGKGAATITDFVDGPNLKGQVTQEIKDQAREVKSGNVDPIKGQRLPREYRDFTRKYFDSLREGSEAEESAGEANADQGVENAIGGEQPPADSGEKKPE